MNLARQWHDDSTAAVSNVEPNTVALNSKDKTNHPSSGIVPSKSTFSYSTHYYRSHLLNHWHVALPIRFSVPFASFFDSFSSSCPLHSVHWLLYWIRLNLCHIRFALCRYLENSCRTMQVNISLKRLGERRWSYCHRRIPLLPSFRANRVNLCDMALNAGMAPDT